MELTIAIRRSAAALRTKWYHRAEWPMWVVVYKGRTVFGPDSHRAASEFISDPMNLTLIERLEVGL